MEKYCKKQEIRVLLWLQITKKKRSNNLATQKYLPACIKFINKIYFILLKKSGYVYGYIFDLWHLFVLLRPKFFGLEIVCYVPGSTILNLNSKKIKKTQLKLKIEKDRERAKLTCF